MKRFYTVFTFLTICLVLWTTSLYAAPALGPDGFAEIPWGASSSQVDEAMKARGFSVDSRWPWNAYSGKLAGTDGRLDFIFERDTFYSGVFAYFDTTKSGGSAANAVGRNFKDIIEAKYGSPTKTDRSTYVNGTVFTWEGLQAPGTSDTVWIELKVMLGSYPYPVVTIAYKNVGLHQRLLAQGKTGL